MCQIRVNLRRWACLLAALACLLALLPLPAHAAGAASKVVRVGWYEDAYNITGKNGERSGYAYEYEQSVAAYTGWTYEYVKAGWSDLLQMMTSGEIDLMAGVSYTEDRAQDMLFSELPMGREIYYLYADLAHTDISASDLRTLNGKRIALLKTSVQAAQFYQWEEDHGLHLQYVWSNSFEQGKQQAQHATGDADGAGPRDRLRHFHRDACLGGIRHVCHCPDRRLRHLLCHQQDPAGPEGRAGSRHAQDGIRQAVLR